MTVKSWLSILHSSHPLSNGLEQHHSQQSKDHPMRENKVSKRSRYIRALGLKEDPFQIWVAENELKEQIAKGNYKNPLFYSFYTPVYNQRGAKIPIRYLRQDRHQIIYGAHGSGKSSLRLWLELECRANPDKTLIVTYTPGESELQPRTIEEHDRGLAQSFTSDLLIQIIEQFDSLCEDLEQLPIAPLAALVVSFPESKRAVKILIEDILSRASAQKRAVPMEQEWGLLDRYAVQPVPATAARLSFLRRLKEAVEEALPIREEANSFRRVISASAAARAWGFERVYLLIDGVDNHETQVDRMVEYMLPLLDAIETFTKHKILYKMFLPRSIQKQVEGYLSQKNKELFRKISRDTIIWRPNGLKNLIIERFRAAGAPYVTSLNALAGHDIQGELEDAVIQMANRSPRRLVQIISRLIDIHLQDSESPETNIYITRSELAKFQQKME